MALPFYQGALKNGYAPMAGYSNSDPNLGASTNPQANVTPYAGYMDYSKNPQGTYVAQPNAGGGIGSSPYSTQSTTTLSSNKSPDIVAANNTFNTLSQKGPTTDTNTGITTLADGSVYNPSTPTVADTTDEDAKIQANLDQMRTNSDAITAAQISSIQTRYTQLKEQQKKINESQLGATTNALLTSGAAQHDVFSNDAIQLRMNQNLDILKELDNEENDLINSAKAAQLTNNNKILEQTNAQIQKKRDEKVELTKKINEDLIAANKKARETQIQSSRDSAIADLYSQGVTDVPTLLNYLNYDDKGNRVGDFTSKEISDTLKNIVPPGLDDLVKTLRQNGAPQDVIAKVMASKDINEAYQNAGAYGAGGTGIIGEYNYYRAQAEAKGQVPVDFNAYQNMDANRKAKIAAAANAAGLTQAGINTALKLSDDYEARSKDFYSQRDAYNRVVSSASDPSPAGDLSLIFNYMKVLDPNSTVREGEFATAQNSGSAWERLGAQYNKVVSGERLTETQRKDFVDRVTKLFQGAKKQQDVTVSEFKTRAKQYGVPDNLVIRDTSATGSAANDIVNDEAKAEKKVIEVSKTNKDAAKSIDTLIAQGMSYADIMATLPEFFK